MALNYSGELATSGGGGGDGGVEGVEGNRIKTFKLRLRVATL